MCVVYVLQYIHTRAFYRFELFIKLHSSFMLYVMMKIDGIPMY